MHNLYKVNCNLAVIFYVYSSKILGHLELNDYCLLLEKYDKRKSLYVIILTRLGLGMINFDNLNEQFNQNKI